ncbi:3-keto-disaccharide hydrolase [Olivibacter sitiensis]|uniref:3-keto-disaccharide hydrolase n=1 Tax=Olivibacter sitiensis TaxID=376470 RepID=UPI0004820D66|nr:DUF1080 domain-containing protein [Olivibacter sitiensis]
MNLKLQQFCKWGIAGTAILFMCSCQPKTAQNNDQEKPEWIELFNGKDLDDWTIKIRKHELGDNYANTFKVEDSLLKVSYEGYDAFDQQYGHIYYNKPFSHYLLRVEYRFVGDQANGGEGWAWRNSGAMLHCQSPASIALDQDFPISLEAQFLGGDGKAERPTGNLCTPGTEAFVGGQLYTEHCLNSSSKTYHGDRWVKADMLVLGDSIIRHIIEGDTVMTYTKPRIGGEGVNDFDPTYKEDGKQLNSGYIALQSESHPVQFRRVALIDLQPYAHDQEKLNAVLSKLRKDK